MDVIVEDEIFARQMEKMYLDDLSNSTEIILGSKLKVRPAQRREKISQIGSTRGSAGRAATGVLAIGGTLGAALTSQKRLGPAEIPALMFAAALLLSIAAIAVYWPHAISVPVAVLGAWAALALLLRILRLFRQHRGVH